MDVSIESPACFWCGRRPGHPAWGLCPLCVRKAGAWAVTVSRQDEPFKALVYYVLHTDLADEVADWRAKVCGRVYGSLDSEPVPGTLPMDRPPELDMRFKLRPGRSLAAIGSVTASYQGQDYKFPFQTESRPIPCALTAPAEQNRAAVRAGIRWLLQRVEARIRNTVPARLVEGELESGLTWLCRDLDTEPEQSGLVRLDLIGWLPLDAEQRRQAKLFQNARNQFYILCRTPETTYHSGWRRLYEPGGRRDSQVLQALPLRCWLDSRTGGWDVQACRAFGRLVERSYRSAAWPELLEKPVLTVHFDEHLMPAEGSIHGVRFPLQPLLRDILPPPNCLAGLFPYVQGLEREYQDYASLTRSQQAILRLYAELPEDGYLSRAQALQFAWPNLEVDGETADADFTMLTRFRPGEGEPALVKEPGTSDSYRLGAFRRLAGLPAGRIPAREYRRDEIPHLRPQVRLAALERLAEAAGEDPQMLWELFSWLESSYPGPDCRTFAFTDAGLAFFRKFHFSDRVYVRFFLEELLGEQAADRVCPEER